MRGGGDAAQLRSSFRERPKASRSKQASSLGPQQGLERRRFAVGVTLPYLLSSREATRKSGRDTTFKAVFLDISRILVK